MCVLYSYHDNGLAVIGVIVILFNISFMCIVALHVYASIVLCLLVVILCVSSAAAAPSRQSM